MERYLLLAGIFLTIGLMLFNKKEKPDSERMILIGTICSVTFMSAELIRYTLKSQKYFKTLLSTSFGVYGVMIFVFSLTYGYYLKLYAELSRRNKLANAALTDGMTGIANRNALSEYLQKIDARKDYGIIFFDVNNLKTANDLYGHETVDQLIIIVAELLKEIFCQDNTLCGRFGGDEFLAIYSSNAIKNCPEATKQFDKALKAINKKKPLPFPIQVAYGAYINDITHPLNSDEGVKQADQIMYEMKKKNEAELLAPFITILS